MYNKVERGRGGEVFTIDMVGLKPISIIHETNGCVRVCRSFGTLSVNHQGTPDISLVIACKLLVGRVGGVIGCWTSVNRVRAT